MKKCENIYPPLLPKSKLKNKENFIPYNLPAHDNTSRHISIPTTSPGKQGTLTRAVMHCAAQPDELMPAITMLARPGKQGNLTRAVKPTAAQLEMDKPAILPVRLKTLSRSVSQSVSKTRCAIGPVQDTGTNERQEKEPGPLNTGSQSISATKCAIGPVQDTGTNGRQEKEPGDLNMNPAGEARLKLEYGGAELINGGYSRATFQIKNFDRFVTPSKKENWKTLIFRQQSANNPPLI